MMLVGVNVYADDDLLHADYPLLTRMVDSTKLLLGRKLSLKREHLPPCFISGGGDEWGERRIAAKWTKGYCHSVLEFGGGSGSVSTVIQKNLANRHNHVVVQPDDAQSMFGGYQQLLKNKQACQMSFHTVDHVLAKNEQDKLLKMVSEPFDCIVADCENCLGEEYKKNPKLFAKVKYIQVERDDKQPLDAPTGPYDALFKQLSMKKVDSGLGCNGRCATEVWMRIDQS